MAVYEVNYIVKRRGKEYPAEHIVEASDAREAIRKTRDYTNENRLPHPFRPTAKKIKN